jgi:hypothetical protein
MADLIPVGRRVQTAREAAEEKSALVPDDTLVSARETAYRPAPGLDV